MSDSRYELPDGITFNNIEEKESVEQEDKVISKISCPYCSFVIKATIQESFGRFTGKLIINNNSPAWNGKLASDPEKSKKQLVDMFNKKVRDHLDKCKTRKK